MLSAYTRTFRFQKSPLGLRLGLRIRHSLIVLVETPHEVDDRSSGIRRVGVDMGIEGTERLQSEYLAKNVSVKNMFASNTTAYVRPVLQNETRVRSLSRRRLAFFAEVFS